MKMNYYLDMSPNRESTKRHALLCSFLVSLLACLLSQPTRAEAPAASVGAGSSPLTAAIALFDAGKYADARVAFANVAAAEPNNARVLFYLGWIAFRQGEPEEAVRFLEKATTFDPTQSLYFHVLGDAYGVSAQRALLFSKFGLARKCIAAYDRGVAVNPDNLEVRMARYHYYRDAPALIGGGMDKAWREAEEIRRRDSRLGTPLLVESYLKAGKPEEAFAFLDGLIRLHPADAFYGFQLGRLAALTGRQLERGGAALEDYLRQTAAGGGSSLAEARWHLGVIRQKQGNRTAARAEFEAALKLCPDLTAAQESLKTLK